METATEYWRALHRKELRSVYSDTHNATYIPQSGERRVEVACLQAGPPGIAVQLPEKQEICLYAEEARVFLGPSSLLLRGHWRVFLGPSSLLLRG
jgi:hypothetical protein